MEPYYTYLIVILSALFFGLIFLSLELKKTAKSIIEKTDKSPNFEISVLAIIILICIFLLPWLFTQTTFSIHNFSINTGIIGDTIGGITAPFINGISAILVYVAFKEQIKANEKQREQFLKQDNDSKLQSFESFFFIMIDNQYKLIETLSFKFKIDDLSTQKNLLPELKDRELIKEKELKGMSCINEFVKILNEAILLPSNTDIIAVYDSLFSKHSSYLSHYLRNLFQFIKLIDDKKLLNDKELLKDFNFISFNDGEDVKIDNMEINVNQKKEVEYKKYEYIKILRAHLSDAQLQIVALNSLTTQGDPFLFYVRKYRLIKNINLTNPPEILQLFLKDNFPQLTS